MECEIKVTLGYYYLLTSYVEIILEATNSRGFSYLHVGVIFEKYILSRSQKLADVDPSGTLNSCYGGNVTGKYTE